MSIKEKIVSQAPRETAGSRSTNRFGYQQHWILCKLLELHLLDEPYIVLCDYHEDVLILDSKEKPSKVEPYQVKSKTTGSWSPKSLISNVKNKGSILGKLCGGVAFLSDEIDKFYFITNAILNAKKEAYEKGNKSLPSIGEIEISSLSEKDKNIIYEALDSELNLEGDRPNIVFLISELAVQDQEKHVKGKILSFLEDKLNIENPPTSAIYTALADQIRRCSTRELTYTNYDELCQDRGISRDDISNILDRILPKQDPNKIWEQAEKELMGNDVDFVTRTKIKKFFFAYDLERLDLSNETLQKYRSHMVDTITGQINNFSSNRFNDIIKEIDGLSEEVDFEEFYRTAIIIREWYEQI